MQPIRRWLGCRFRFSNQGCTRKLLATDDDAPHRVVGLLAPRTHLPAVGDGLVVLAALAIVLAPHHVALKCSLVNLFPSLMQAWKNFILASANQGNDLLKAEFLDPHAIRDEVAHLLVKHGQSHGRVLHQDL